MFGLPPPRTTAKALQKGRSAGSVPVCFRNVFPKDRLHWVEQGKLLYADKNKIQALIDQQRINLADVAYRNLDSVNSILQSFANPQGEISEENILLAPAEPITLSREDERKFRDCVERMVEVLADKGYDKFDDLVRAVASRRTDICGRASSAPLAEHLREGRSRRNLTCARENENSMRNFIRPYLICRMAESISVIADAYLRHP